MDVPGINGYRAALQDNLLRQHNDAQQATVGVGIMQRIQKQQQDLQLREALAKGDTAALMKLPGGIDILGKLATQQNAGVTAALHGAQLGEIQRKGAISNQEQQAKGALANLVAGGGYQANNPNEMAPTAVMQDPAAAEKAAIEQYRKDPNTPLAIDVPNPANVKGLAIAAGNALPRSASAALLNPGGGGQAIAPRVVQDANSPTGWGYLQGDRTITPGAPAPASVSRVDAAAVGNSGAGMMTPETLKFTAQQIIAGDRQAGQGYARSAPMKAALQNAVMEEAKAQGITGKDLAGIMAEYAGVTAGQRSLGTRQAQIEMAATVTSQFAPLAITASEAFDRTPFKSLNDIEKAVLSRTASPELRKFNFANTSLINAYARAVNPNGVGTVSDKDHAREILDTGFSKGDYKAAVDQLQMEINAELEAPGRVKADMRKRFTGNAVQTGDVPNPVREFSTEADAIKSGVKGAVKIGGRNARID